jgi:hypothetical protein
MNGRRAIVGLCMLCALLVSAFAAQSASAVGTTAYTCTTGGASDYAAGDTHCKTNVGAGKGTLGHIAIANLTTTELIGSNETTGGAKTNTLLKATIAGAAVTLTGATTTGSGSMENVEEGGEMIAKGTGTITYSGVTATGGCKVFTDNENGTNGEEGVIHTEPLKASTKGVGDKLKFEPAVGTVFARFNLANCTNTGINGTYTVTGSVISTNIEGATTNFTHADTTTQNTLKLNGTIKAGIEGTLTLKSKKSTDAAGTHKPLSATT